MTPHPKLIIGQVVQEHAEEVAYLYSLRPILTTAPHITLDDLFGFDDRIAAHLDGLSIAGENGWHYCAAPLDSPSRGQVFTAAVWAIESKQRTKLDRVFALVEALPEGAAALISAFGWVSARLLKGTAKELLDNMALFRKIVGLAAFLIHRVDPGESLNIVITCQDTPLRVRALRGAGELGRRDLLPKCIEYLKDQDHVCAFWAAWSSVLLGDRSRAVESLRKLSVLSAPRQERALRLVLKALSIQEGHVVLKTLAQNPSNQRELIRGTGIVGDPFYIPWLIKQLGDAKTARLAGEAFSFITGLDLAYLDLDQKPPENFESGPNDNPNDDNVAMDEDDDLSWPDPAKIRAWWSANSYRFQADTRYFMGEPVSRAHCVKVLKEGYQRQRIAAAEYLCLLNPGTPLFNTSAPAWRQKRLLEKME